MRWCFDNTSTPYAEEVLEQTVGRPASPRAGVVEVVKVHGFLEDIQSLDITVDDESFGHIFGNVHRFAVEHGLSGYDAAYLELAIRKGRPLATLDEDLQRAARVAGVKLFQPA